MNARCGAIILAAGQSRRMGSNKLIAPFRGKPMITHIADAVEEAGLRPVVVLGHAERKVRTALAGCRAEFVFAADHAEGMGRSIAAGIAVAPQEWDAAIVCLGDMPLVSPALLRQLADAASPSAIVIPTFNGQQGNPRLWGRDYFPDLVQLKGDIGARVLFPNLNAHVISLRWRDDTILRDFDTPEALFPE